MGAILAATPFVVRLLERVFTGDKRGNDRMNLGKKILKSIGDAAGEDVKEDTLQGVIEAIFQQLKTSGALAQEPQGSYYLIQAISIQKLDVSK